MVRYGYLNLRGVITLLKAVTTYKLFYAQCPMPNAQCPITDAQDNLIK